MSLTAANAVITIGIDTVFPIPQTLKGFAADDVFDTDEIKSVETQMGVDGVLSGGFVFVEVAQKYKLQADSASCAIFDAWYAAQVAAQDVFNANGGLSLKTLKTKWAMTKGFLTGYKPAPDAKKLLQPRVFTITWQSILPAPA